MKRSFAILLSLTLLCAAGCSKGGMKASKPISFEGLEVQASAAQADYQTYQHFSEIRERYNLSKSIVFRGVKEGLSTPIQEYDEDGAKGLAYCETDLRVLEVFYGNVQVDDIISHKEWVEVVERDGITYVLTPDGVDPIEENEEYIFILSKLNQSSSEGNDIYGTYSLHYSYHKVSDFETLKDKVTAGTATERENFGYEVLDYYLGQPSTELDLQLEASKFVDNLSEGATEEEILAELPDEQQKLFEKMIEQYGTK